MNNEKEIIEKIVEKYNLELGEDYFYVGASIIKKSDFPQSTEILYCEDGFNDEEGIPYIMQSTVPKGVFERDRILVFYTKDLKRYIIPIDGENYTLIGNNVPENVKNINYGKAKKIIHRKALELKKEPEKLTEEEVEDLYKRYIKSYKKGIMLVTGILSSILWFILISICVLFINEKNNNEILGFGTIIVGIILFIIGSIFIIRFFMKLPARRLKSFVYKTDFLVMNYYKDSNMKGYNDRHIVGLTYDGNNCKLMNHTISHYDLRFIEQVEFYEIVNRYSKSKSPNYFEYCLFERKTK